MTPEQAALISTLRAIVWRKQYQQMHTIAAQVMDNLRTVWQNMQPAIHQIYTTLVDAGYITPPIISENERRRRAWVARHMRRQSRPHPACGILIRIDGCCGSRARWRYGGR